MALGNALQSRQKFTPPTLEITSMMDMFTIILFFLLFAYGEKPQEITMKEDISLPLSSSEKEFENTVKIFVTEDRILIEKEVIASIVGNNIVGYDKENPERSSIFSSIKLHKERQVSERSLGLTVADNAMGAEASGGDVQGDKEKKEFSVLLFCDRKIPFSLMRQLMKVTGMAGYPNFQLAVLEK